MDDILSRIVGLSPAVAIAWADTRRERATFVTPNVSRLGLDAADILAGRQSVADLMHPADAPRVRAETDQALALGRDELRLAYRIVTPDGRTVRVEETSRLVREDGRIGIDGLLLERIAPHDEAHENMLASGLDFRAVVEDQSEVISRFLPDGTLTFVNEAYCRFHGLTRRELMGSSIYAAIPEEDRERVRRYIQALTPERPADTLRHRVLLPHGEVRWMEWVDRAFFDELGLITEFQSMGRDVTAEVQAQAALAEANALLSAIVEHVPTPIYLRDTDHRYRIINPAYTGFWGLETGTGLGKTPHEFLPPEAADKIVEGDRAVLSGLRPLEEEEVFTRDGEQRILWSREVPLLDESGSPWGICGVVLDVTERRQAEEALVRTQAMLMAVVECTPWPLYLRDREHRYHIANLAYERAWGLRPGQAESRTPHEILPPSEADKIVADDEVVLSSRSPLEKEEVLLFPGGPRTMWTREIPLQGADGEPWAVCGVSVDITERKQAEVRLRESEAKYSKLFHTIPGFIVVSSLEEGRCLEVSDGFTELAGYGREEVLGRTASEFDFWTDAPGRDERILPLRRAGRIQDFEARIRCKSGEERTILVSADTLEIGGEPCIIAVGQDITARKRMEAELADIRQNLEVRVAERTRQLRLANQRLSREIADRRAAENDLRRHQKQLRAILDNLPSHVYVRDTSGRYLLINRQYERFWSLPEGSAVGRTPREMLPAADAEKILADDALILAEGRPLDLDESFVRAGRVHTFMTREVPLLDERGQAYAVCGISTDVSERKRMEAALRESESNLRGLFNAIGQIVVLLDASGRVLAANETCVRALGVSPQKFVGCCIFEYFETDEAASRRAAIERVLATGLPSLVRVHYRDSILKTSLYPILGEDGRVARVAVFSEDVTHEVTLERQLRRAQRLEAVGTLASGVAHEFNNMLTIITGFAEMALEDPADADDCLRRVLRTASRGRDIVRQMLTFSRGDESPREPLDLSQTVRECLELARAGLPRSIPLEARLAGTALPVRANPTQIQQLLINLTVNAAEAMNGSGAPRGDIRVCLDRCVPGEDPGAPAGLLPCEHARLSVTDTGPGMEPHVLERIFDPFFTTKEPGKGTGLGLAVVHGIVKALDGDISAVSAPGQGTRFDIFLPIVTGNPVAPSESADE